MLLRERAERSVELPISAKVGKTLGTWVILAGDEVHHMTRGRDITAHILACNLTADDRMNPVRGDRYRSNWLASAWRLTNRIQEEAKIRLQNI
jgi:hypothetical protein